jgi:cell wall-associated NlpC family hydrolase/soluble lytic murein transglycosylase-like protein
MRHGAGKIRAVAVAAVALAATSLPIAAANAEEAPVETGAAVETWPAPSTPTPAPPPPVEQGATLEQPATNTPSAPSGGVTAGGEGRAQAAPEAEQPEGSVEFPPAPDPSTALTIPALPASSCAATGVPPVLVPIYRRAAATYGLGPQGPAVLAGINEVETAFGTNLNVSSAGALGWMQFMPSSWEAYGVDANGDGVEDPYNPEDAIFAAAGYLRVAGMPANTYDAIFAYNHADWYVSEVLANAGCYAKEVGGPSFDAAGLGPQIQVLQCTAAPAWKDAIPKPYMTAFEDAAARYELGKRGVWALAAVAHLESEFGRGMSKAQMRREGPLGLDRYEWSQFGVDGDEDGHIHHSSPGDSAATLARMIWSRGGLEAGLFTHNQAEWYVREVLADAEQIEGKCKTDYIEWAVAPLGSGFETAGESAVLLGNLASAPRSAPPAVKAAISAANSISTTPYVWGGGHSSWYSYGYDCSGAVSFALYGAGLLDTPLTSGQLESYGEPGPGKWITIYASPTHTYAVIAGLRWDTVGDAEGTGPRWHTEPPYPEGFVVRHPTGY